MHKYFFSSQYRTVFPETAKSLENIYIGAVTGFQAIYGFVSETITAIKLFASAALNVVRKITEALQQVTYISLDTLKMS